MFSRFLASFFCFFVLFSPASWAIDDPFSARKPAAAQTQDEFLTAEQAYQADLMLNDGQWVVSWQMADRHFLYRHGFRNEWIENGKTRDAGTPLPAGLQRSDEYFGDVEIYYQQVQMPVSAPDPQTSTAYLKVTSQGCADAGLCYPPYSIYFAIDTTDNSTSTLSEKEFRTLTGAATSPTARPQTAADSGLSLGWIFLSALLGGLILNLMPCVLPVLSIKVMQLVRHPDSPEARKEGLAYMAGVISGFVAIASLMLALRAGGTAIGWGFQLQNPWLVAGLAYLFFILGLSMAGTDMSGITRFGQRFLGMGQSLTDISGLPGAFFTGVLAVVVASPCTAPFMSAALGYAITQPAAIALLVFAALGLGMALPVTMVSFIPGAARMLPKPGHWMQQLKQFFAFPLFATATWLAWVFGNQTGTLGMAMLLCGCILLAFALWCLNHHRLPGRLCGILALFAAIALTWQAGLNLPSSKKPKDNHEPFSTQRLHELRQQGRAVFVDLTADWCITCKVNEKSTLETAQIQQAFRDAGIIYMVGDWTDYNPEITALLSEYQRSGIPLYLLFPARPNAEPLLLPQLLTPGIVLKFINDAKVSAN